MSGRKHRLGPVSIALVLLMTPGLAFFYGGPVDRRQVINTIKMSFVALGVIALEWGHPRLPAGLCRGGRQLARAACRS